MRLNIDLNKLKRRTRESYEFIVNHPELDDNSNRLLQMKKLIDDPLDAPDEIKLFRRDLSKFFRIYFLLEVRFQSLNPRSEFQTLRGLWYISAKNLATWFNLVELKKNYKDVENYYGTMNSVLTDMVRDGIITYKQLKITDKSRDRYVEFDSDIFGTDNQVTVIACEKEDFMSYLKEPCKLMGYTLYSLKGQPSMMATEDMCEQLRENYRLNKDDATFNLVILVDYDYHGLNIAKNFIEQVEFQGWNVKPIIVEWWKVLIDPFDQVWKEEYTEHYVPLKMSNYTMKHWAEKNGICRETEGGDKEYYGLEVNAMAREPKELRRLVWNVLEEHGLIRFEVRDELAFKNSEPNVNEVANRLANDKMKDHPKVKKIAELQKEIRRIKRELSPIKSKYIEEFKEKLEPIKWDIETGKRLDKSFLLDKFLRKKKRTGFWRKYSRSKNTDKLYDLANKKGFLNQVDEKV